MMATTARSIDGATLVGRDYIETLDWSVDEIEEALAVAASSRRPSRSGQPHRLLPDKTLFMLFFDKSTRTRNAFETGMTQLGGHAIYLDADKTQVAHGESPKDMGIILSRYGDGLAIRHDLAPYEGNAWMREIARWADIPLINLQCDVDHPTQTLADLMTLREKRGENLRGLKVAVSWAYAPSYAKPLSVPQGLATLLPRFGIDVALAHPPGLRADAGGDGAGRGGRRRSRARRSRSPTTWTRRSRAPTSSTRSPGAGIDAFTDESKALAESGAYERLDLRRAAHGAREGGRAVHALPAGRPRQRGDRRGDRRPAVGRLRRGREPHAHRQGAHGADDGRVLGERARRRRRGSARQRLVVAIGGNCAASRPWRARRRSDDPAQRTRARPAEHIVADDRSDGYDVVIGHGNGPQVGFILRRCRASAYARRCTRYPLDVCGADSQGTIGYALAQNLENRLPGRRPARVTVLTQVEVDADDPAFQRALEADRLRVHGRAGVACASASAAGRSPRTAATAGESSPSPEPLRDRRARRDPDR